MVARLIAWLRGRNRPAPAEKPLEARTARSGTGRASKSGKATHGPPADDTGGDHVEYYGGMVYGELFDRPDVLIVDTETTGLGPRSEIVELAVIDTTGTLRFAAPVMPQGRISGAASDIHGLTRARLRELGAKPWPEHHAEVHALLSGRLMIGWNVGFDERMIRQTCERYGLPMPRLAFFDMLAFYRRSGPERDRYSLGNVLHAEGLQWEGTAHRAEADARAVLAIMRSLLGRSMRT